MSSLIGTVLVACGDLGAGAGGASSVELGFAGGGVATLARFAGGAAFAVGVAVFAEVGAISTTGAALGGTRSPSAAEALATEVVTGLGRASSADGAASEDELVRGVGAFARCPRKNITMSKPMPADTKRPRIARTHKSGGPCLWLLARARLGSGCTAGAAAAGPGAAAAGAGATGIAANGTYAGDGGFGSGVGTPDCGAPNG